MSATSRAPRRADLDWLRVGAVALLVPFHAAIVFILDPNVIVYMKGTVQSDFLQNMAGFIARWQMELLFFIAGAASWYALSRRKGGQYVSERFLRLLVPFVFGTLTFIPLMTYVHYLTQPYVPSLAEHYAHFFTLNRADLTGLGGNWTPGHLWFILYLFVFSLVGLPLFLLLRRQGCQSALARIAAWPGTIYIPAILLFLARQMNLLGDKNPLYYFLVFLIGYVFISQPGFQSAIDRYLPLSLALALAATIIPEILSGGVDQSDPAIRLTGIFLFRLSQWTWVLTILAVGHRWLNREGRELRYLSEAAYPFYILHLPVMTLVTYYTLQLGAVAAVQYLLIVIATTLLTLAVYDLVVKRVGVLRFLFGMKAAPRVARPAAPMRQPMGT
jgi:glucans biosynthesis protein C